MSPMQYLHRAGVFSTHLAIASFAIGTLLLLTYGLLPNVYVVLIGLVYVIVAIVVNLIVFLSLLVYCFTQPAYREYFAVKMLIMLANVPIAVLYFLIITHQF